MDQLNGYPKGLLVKCYEANVASLITKHSTRPVMEMVSGLDLRPSHLKQLTSVLPVKESR